jgi:hypothetical protein
MLRDACKNVRVFGVLDVRKRKLVCGLHELRRFIGTFLKVLVGVIR